MLAALQDLALALAGFARAHPVAAVTLVLAGAVWYVFCMRRASSAQHLPAMLYGYRDVRRCGGGETFQSIMCEQYGAFRTASVFRVRGPAARDVTAVTRACWALQTRFPALRWGVHVKSNGQYWFHEYADARKRVSVTYVPRASDDSWQHALEELNNSWLQGVSNEHLQWRLVVSLNATAPDPDTATHEFLLLASHSILDGTSRMLFSMWFVKALALIAARPHDREFVPQFEPVPVHDSMERMCAQHPAWLSCVSAYQRCTPDSARLVAGWLWDSAPKHRPPTNGVKAFGLDAPPLQRRDHCVFQKVESTELKALLAATKSRGLRLHAVLVGCMAHAWQCVWGLKAGAKFEHTSPVRVREYAPDPKAVAGVIGHTAAFFDHKLTLREPAADDSAQSAIESAWQYARDINAYMYADPRTRLPGSAFASVYDFDGMRVLGNPLIRDILWHDAAGARFANLCVSNLGDCSAYGPKRDGPYEVVDWHCAQGQRLMGQDSFVAIASFHGDMFITWTYTSPLFARDKAERFYALTRATIKACADAGSVAGAATADAAAVAGTDVKAEGKKRK